MSIIISLLTATLLTGLIAAILPSVRWSAYFGLTGSLIYGLVWTTKVYPILMGVIPALSKGPFRVDALSALMVVVISIITLLASMYSVPYIQKERQHGALSEKKIRIYFLAFHVFAASMYAMVCFGNLGLVWVSVEATTLASAVLVSLYGKRGSLEAAWKYLILCSLGIALALFGTVLVYHTGKTLDWFALVNSATQLDVATLRLAFAFILVGYGTKGGLVPMHTWLPDAHSQAPTPISAVLSGILLSCALYGIARFSTIVALAGAQAFAASSLMGLGLVSLIIAIPLLYVQRDIKRFLAYSSVEHMGIIALGLGFGLANTQGLTGSILHIVFHALGKSTLFFVAGAIIQRFGTKRILRIRGLLSDAPFLGITLMLSMLAMAGMPLFGPFISELWIGKSGFDAGHPIIASTYFILLAIAFGVMVLVGTNMVYGTRRTNPVNNANSRVKLSLLTATAIVLPLLILLILGTHIPNGVRTALQNAAYCIKPLR